MPIFDFLSIHVVYISLVFLFSSINQFDTPINRWHPLPCQASIKSYRTQKSISMHSVWKHMAPTGAQCINAYCNAVESTLLRMHSTNIAKGHQLENYNENKPETFGA